MHPASGSVAHTVSDEEDAMRRCAGADSGTCGNEDGDRRVAEHHHH